jgi:hypothetical protein
MMNRLAYATVHVICNSILLTMGWFEKVGKSRRIYCGLPKQQANDDPNGSKKSNEHDLIVVFGAGFLAKKHLEYDPANKRKYHHKRNNSSGCHIIKVVFLCIG